MKFLEWLKEVDTNLLFAINGWTNMFFDHTMYIYTAKETWFLFYLVLVLMIIKHFGRRALVILPAIALTILFTDQLCNVFKYGFARPRPGHDPVIGDLIYIFYKKGGRFGFVSAHSANAFAMAAFMIGVFKNQWFKWTILFWAALIAYSRPYLGVHYPGDIICGGLLGAAIGYGMYRAAMFAESKVFKDGEQRIANFSIDNGSLAPYFVIYVAMLLIPMLINALYLKHGYIG